MLDQQISRRKLIRNSALLGAGILLGYGAGGVRSLNAEEAKKAAELNVSLYIKISPDNTVHLILPNTEMGQGIHTAQAMVIAEELEVNLDNVVVSDAPPLPAYGKLRTGGSISINKNFDKLIKIGATAREMLIEAASLEWQVPRDECIAKSGYVSHISSGRSFIYGELTEKASSLAPPQDPRIKNRKEYQLIGQGVPRIDIPEKINGSATYGMDVRLPNLLFAIVKSAPRRGGEIVDFNEEKALKIKGVKAVVKIPEEQIFLKVSEPEPGESESINFPESIAVVAESNWQAMKAMESLSPKFLGGNSEEMSDEKIVKLFSSALDYLENVFIEDVEKQEGYEWVEQDRIVQSSAHSILKNDYYFPLQTHAALEPLNFTVNYTGNFCEVWGPSQSQSDIARILEELTGFSGEKIKINLTTMGGSFGSKQAKDALRQALYLSEKLYKPIQLMWTREHEMQNSYPMQMSQHRVQIGLDEKKYPEFWHHRIAASHSAAHRDEFFRRWIKSEDWGTRPAEPNCGDGFPPLYKVGKFDFQLKFEDLGIPSYNLRTTGSTQNCFVMESAVDELAYLADTDPLNYRLNLLRGNERCTEILEGLSRQSNWTTSLDNGFGRGIAIYEFMVKNLWWENTPFHRNNLGMPTTVVAASAIVSVTKRGRLKIEKIYFRLDCGLCVNPNVVRSQIEGGIIMGISLAMNEKLTIKAGSIAETNYDEYKIAKMKHTPEIDIEIVQSDLPPSGVGEPPVAPVIPAITNAIFAATGRRIRKLPIGKQRLI